MNERNLLTLALGVSLALFPAILPAAPLAENEVLKLPSGHVAKILSVSRIEYAKGVSAVMVRYQTTLSMDEPRAVSQEVDEVWKFAQKEVEHAGCNEAVLSSNETPKGLFITASRIQNFIYEKNANGTWTRLNREDLALQ